MKRIKLSEYAKQNGVTRQTAYRWWRNGELNGIQLSTGTILINQEINTNEKGAVLYSRVSSSQNKNNLKTQAKRLKDYAAAKGYNVKYDIQETGSGLNDNRKQLQSILLKNDWDVIIVEHKDRLTRFGFNYISTLLEKTEQRIEVINETTDETDLLDDLTSIITSFCARIYGQRRSRRKTEKIIEELNKND